MSRLGAKLLAVLIFLYLRLVYLTSRKTYNDKERLNEIISLHQAGDGFVFAFWHGRLAMTPQISRKKRRVCAIISRHKDGTLIATVIRLLGMTAVRGSSDRKASENKSAKYKGGKRVFREALTKLEEGYIIAMTPDGPRGPSQEMQMGAIQLAKHTGASIIPCGYSCKRGKIINSWDRFLFPYPFNRIHYFIGAPITVPEDADDKAMEKARITAQNQLNLLTEEADRACGRTSN